MKILKYSENNHSKIISAAIEVLKKGGIFVFPTETCYGLGADATNPKAIAKLYQYKARREGKPLSIAVSDLKMAAKYVEINEMATNLYTNYLPGPITVVSKSKGNLAPGVESEYGTLGIRIPNYPLILEIARQFDKPFTATSANASYLPKPYSIAALLQDTPVKSQALLDLIIDAGELPHREASTVVDTTMNNLNIMRPGQITLKKQLTKKEPVLAAKTVSDQETVSFGGLNLLKYIDEPLDKPLVFFLSGEMGSGKTRFSKGLAEKLKIKDIIKSPTFTILNEYDYKLGQRCGKFIHVDTWRLENSKDLESVGLDQYLQPGNVIAIEWADKFLIKLKKKIELAGGRIINVIFHYLDENTRTIETYE